MEITNSNLRTVLVNGIDGDPAVYTFFTQTGEACLFDMGSLEALSNRELLKVRHVFVSHTHIDHFIGFDKLLRVNVPHFRKIEVCGPTGIIENVYGKLRGYTWNLVEPGQVEFIVRELDPSGKVKSARLVNERNFRPLEIENEEPMTGPAVRPLPEKPASFITNLSDGTRVEAVCLDHGTSSVAYVLQAPMRFTVKTSELERLKLEPGPWIRELQIAWADGKFDTEIEAGGKKWHAKDLGAEIMNSAAPRIIAYVTDIIFSESNLTKTAALFRDVELIICESNFSEVDHAKARQKKHLTTKQAALIAATARADRLQIFHISNIYSGRQAEIAEEARRFFSEYSALSEEDLQTICHKEF